MNTIPSSEPFPAQEFNASAGAFSQLAGVLGGFCFTILVLVLSPDFMRGSSNVKDWALALLLLASLSYVMSSSFLANSMNAPLIRSITLRRRIFDVGMLMSNAGHILLASALTILVYQVSSPVGLLAAAIIVVFVVFNFFLNVGVELLVLRGKS